MEAYRTTDIVEIQKKLQHFWGNEAKVVSPRFRPVLCYSQTRRGQISGFLYAHDIQDGYFHELRIDDIYIRKVSGMREINLHLISSAVEYAKAHGIKRVTAAVNVEELGATEVYRRLGFAVDPNVKIAELELD